MQLIKVQSNLFIQEDYPRNVENQEVAHNILRFIDLIFSKNLNIAPFSSRACVIIYNERFPRCGLENGMHIIGLSANEDDWWRWVFQFAHEYCHHLIDGSLNGEIKGLKWFEETICQLSSIYYLNKIALYSSKYPLAGMHNNQDQFRLALNANIGLYQTNCLEYLLSVEDLLSESEYHREIYSNLAATMLPLFVENPYLWKIILHFGDTCQWNSLSDLFAHLDKTADDSYLTSLFQLKNLLIP